MKTSNFILIALMAIASSCKKDPYGSSSPINQEHLKDKASKASNVLIADLTWDASSLYQHTETTNGTATSCSIKFDFDLLHQREYPYLYEINFWFDTNGQGGVTFNQFRPRPYIPGDPQWGYVYRSGGVAYGGGYLQAYTEGDLYLNDYMFVDYKFVVRANTWYNGPSSYQCYIEVERVPVY